MALTLALAACDKSHTVQPEPAPVKAPTGAITNTLLETSPELRLGLVQRVKTETLGAGENFYTRGFLADASKLSTEHVHQLDVGFGPQRGTHVVTVSQSEGKIFVCDMLDGDNDGNVDFVESSTSWSVRKTDTSTPMTHIEKDNRITQGIQDAYASALKHSLLVLEAEKEAEKKKQK